MTRPVTAQAPTQSNNEDYESGPLIIKTNAIQPPARSNIIEPNSDKALVKQVQSGRHSLATEKRITPEQLSEFLGTSPLAAYSSQILESSYWSTIIGICWIEQRKCVSNPYGSNNFWGMMSKGQIIRYPSIEIGIQAIHKFLDKAYGNGRTTVESFRGWYCASACTNWEPTVIKIKTQLESLN